MLQCVAVCCSVLHCVAVQRVCPVYESICGSYARSLVCCSMLQCVVVCFSVLQCVAVQRVCPILFVTRLLDLWCLEVCCSMSKFVTVCCSVLQCVAVQRVCPI